MSAPDYGPILDETELDLHARNMAWSFKFPKEVALESFRRVGADRIRVLRKGGQVVGGLTLYPLGQWIGGRRLDMTGVNLVGMAPEHRGGGTATTLMEAAVKEMRAEGAPISVLYPAKQTLYRRAGYELAGARYENEITLRDLDFGNERQMTVRPYEDADLEAIRTVYRSVCRESTGPIDRPDFMWKKITDPLGDGREVRGYVVEGDDGCEGYVFVEETDAEGFAYELSLLDFVASSGRASRRLLRFLGDHSSLGNRAMWYGDPTDVAFMAMREQTWKTKISFRWMLRILDPVAALEQRGYPEGLESELHLELDDALFPENSGRLRLAVSGGRGSVTTGGSGALRADVRGLASIYTGYLTPPKARRAGRLDGTDEAMARAAAIFASSGEPWMADMF